MWCSYGRFGEWHCLGFQERGHSSSLKKEEVGSSEILVLWYQTKRRHIPQGSILQQSNCFNIVTDCVWCVCVCGVRMLRALCVVYMCVLRVLCVRCICVWCACVRGVRVCAVYVYAACCVCGVYVCGVCVCVCCICVCGVYVWCACVVCVCCISVCVVYVCFVLCVCVVCVCVNNLLICTKRSVLSQSAQLNPRIASQQCPPGIS